MVCKGEVKASHVRTELNIADIFTKPLTTDKHRRLVSTYLQNKPAGWNPTPTD